MAPFIAAYMASIMTPFTSPGTRKSARFARRHIGFCVGHRESRFCVAFGAIVFCHSLPLVLSSLQSFVFILAAILANISFHRGCHMNRVTYGTFCQARGIDSEE